MMRHFAASVLRAVFFISILAATARSALATGTALITQRDGTMKTYTNVHIAIRDQSMAITSSDGRGTLVLGKAACTKIGELLKCIPYDATLLQYGQKVHIPLQSGTAWLNPTQTPQQLTYSSAHLPGHGVILFIKTKAGTTVSLSGKVDEVIK
jgi:hypothetical protein